MPFKTILVHVDDGAGCGKRLEASARLASAFAARLVGIYLQEDTDLTSAVAAMLPPEVVERRQRELADARQAAERLFRRTSAAAGVPIEWHAPERNLVDAAVAHGRCADLFVMGQRDPDDPQRSFVEGLLTTTVLSTGRPALVVPYTGARPSLGENVVVAWDNGREAARAIADAMPFLERAKQVSVLAIDPESGAKKVDTQAVVRLSAYLRDHGIRTTIDRDTVSEIGIGDRLLSRAADLGADLMVMGGYAHTRLRELVLGGVTRTMLESMTIPVLMSH